MSNAGYFGFARPDTPETPYASVEFIVRSVLAGVVTVELVKVTAVGSGTVDVQPLVNQIDGLGQAVAHGIVPGVPVWRLQGGAGACILDPVVGDIGVMLVAGRDSSTVVSTKAQANPGSFRRFDWADGVYLGGVLNGDPTRYVKLSTDGTVVVDPNQVTIQSPTITLQGAVTVTGNLTVNGTSNLGGSGGSPVKTAAGTATKANAV